MIKLYCWGITIGIIVLQAIAFGECILETFNLETFNLNEIAPVHQDDVLNLIESLGE